MRDSEQRKYTKDWLQYDRPQPMYDASINILYKSVFKEESINRENLVAEFKFEFIKYINSHSRSQFTGIDSFLHTDICIGCTQFIDDIYQRVGTNNVMIFENEYKYHWRLNNNIKFVTLDTLDATKELIISMPFPACGDTHPLMDKILDRCWHLNIPVHIDGAWISCSKNITFNFDHPAIKTFAISLSKGGMGNDRIALRFARLEPAGAITIMNKFNMNCKSLLHVGIKYMQDIGPEYFWQKYEDRYYKVCEDFNLVPTKAIHVAKTQNGSIVGVRPLLRCKL
jgi:hypothetical protein